MYVRIGYGCINGCNFPKVMTYGIQRICIANRILMETYSDLVGKIYCKYESICSPFRPPYVKEGLILNTKWFCVVTIWRTIGNL